VSGTTCHAFHADSILYAMYVLGRPLALSAVIETNIALGVHCVRCITSTDLYYSLVSRLGSAIYHTLYQQHHHQCTVITGEGHVIG